MVPEVKVNNDAYYIVEETVMISTGAVNDRFQLRREKWRFSGQLGLANNAGCVTDTPMFPE
jgi:hypothetical protein